MKKRDVFIILIFLLIALVFLWLFWNDLTQTISSRDQEPVGTVVVKRNVVQRRFADRVLWDRLRVESPVYIGNLIRVPENSAAILNIIDSSFALDENTLVRITLSPDGEIQIDLMGGSISVISDTNSSPVLININGEIIRTMPGTVMTASYDEEIGSSIKYHLSANEILDREQFAISDSYSKLASPAKDSVYRLYDEPLFINFNWTRIEQAEAYILEISDTPDFSANVIRREGSAVTHSEILDEGKWYWRVMPVYPSVYEKAESFSEVSSFSIAKSDIPLAELEKLSLSEWLLAEAPKGSLPEPEPVPPSPPPRPTPARPAPQPVRPVPQPVRPAPRPIPAHVPQPVVAAEPKPLSPPTVSTPMNNRIFGHQELQQRREIVFSWQPVEEANNYIFTLYQETTAGRRQIIRTAPSSSTNYTLNNFRDLENGNYVWQVEAVSNTDGVERRVTTGEQIFSLNVPSVAPIQTNEIGIEYGN